MQKVTEKPSSRRRGRSPAARDDPRRRFAIVWLPEEALQDALEGLAPEEITGSGGLMPSSRAG
jgi:hypothetical protein